MSEKKLTDEELKTVAGGWNIYDCKYRPGNILYDKGNDRRRFEVREIIDDGAGGYLYRGMIQIYSLVPPGNGGVLPLPMTPPKYSWFDNATVSYSEAGLEEIWETR